ncbi:unnamed protein product [Paramecium pentaurelia]|uniref:Uncharacterized protein n=1 Tax=Paramecium pentaurelia TaxID=43138 RepID=A0A8S1WUM8_9CILI|nr:unnamed protein product [Paramecium pentaurelia]
MSFERMRKSFKSFLGLNTSPQIDQSSQASIPQELQSSNSSYNIKNKFVQIEKKQERLNPYKKSLLRLNEYQKTIIKGTDCSKCPTIQYSINQDEKPVIDHKITNPRWKREDQSQDYSSYTQRWSSLNDVPNPTYFQVQSKHTKNQPYDPQTLSQSKLSIKFQKNQFHQYMEDKPINVIRNDKNSPLKEKKKKSSQISIRRTDSVIFDVQDEPLFENGRQTVQKLENLVKNNEDENHSASESIIIKKQSITRFNKLIKQEHDYNPKTLLIETKPISPSYRDEQQKQTIQQIQQVKQQENTIQNSDGQIQQVQQKQQSSDPIEQIKEPLLEIKQELIIQQKLEQQPSIQIPVIEVNPFTSNVDCILFNAPWITNQIPQNQQTFNILQSQPIQNQYQTPFIQQQQQQQSAFPFQNDSQIQQNVYSNQTFFSQQVQASSNPFTTNQLNQNFFNQGNTQQPQTVYQSFQQDQQKKNDLFGFNQKQNNNNNNNNTFLFQTNSLGGGSFSADDQNKPLTIDLFSSQPIQNSKVSMITSQAAVNLFTLDHNSSAQPQNNKESDRYKNRFKQNTVKYNAAAQRME